MYPRLWIKPPAPIKSLNEDLKDMAVFAPLKTTKRSKILNMGVSKTSDHIQIRNKKPNPSQEPPVSSKETIKT